MQPYILPQLDAEPERTIDELRDDIRATETKPEHFYVIEEWSDRRIRRDAILDLQDELNDAGLVIVPEAEWKRGQLAIYLLKMQMDAAAVEPPIVWKVSDETKAEIERLKLEYGVNSATEVLREHLRRHRAP